MSGLPSMPPGVWQSEQPAIDTMILAARDLRVVGERRGRERRKARPQPSKRPCGQKLRPFLASLSVSAAQPPEVPAIGIPLR